MRRSLASPPKQSLPHLTGMIGSATRLRADWIAPALGAEQALAPANWRMTGPLAFASSYISPNDADDLNAAIISGLRAAEDFRQFSGRDQRQAGGVNVIA